MGKITPEWAELKSFLPEGWEEKAKESKAICRTRKVGGAEELLRVELLHFGEGLSLKETSAVAKEGGISCQRRSDFVVFRRTGNVEKWRVNVYSL